MLRITLTLFLLAGALSLARAQEDTPFELPALENPPEFPGGEQALYNFVNASLKYPRKAFKNNIQGTVVIIFVINKDGSISDVSISKDIGGGCGHEAMRVIKALPNWQPGVAAGKYVRVRYTFPVRFKLDEVVPPPSVMHKPVPDDRVWEIVHREAEETFTGKEFPKSFVLKPRMKGTRDFMQTTCNKFSINISRADMNEITSLGALNDYIIKSQRSVELYTGIDFGSWGQCFATSRPSCRPESECPPVIQSVIVPKGYIVTFYTEPDFEGDKLKINAASMEYQCANLSMIAVDKQVTTSNPNLDWSISVQSIKIVKQE